MRRCVDLTDFVINFELLLGLSLLLCSYHCSFDFTGTSKKTSAFLCGTHIKAYIVSFTLFYLTLGGIASF